MSIVNSRQGPNSDRRRSQRVLLSIAVRISSTNGNGVAFAEETRTVIVNAQGGLVLLKAAMRLGQRLKITNLNTNEETICTAIDSNAGSNEAHEVGVEFAAPTPRFWRISFPPIDWSSRSPEAKRFEKANPTNETKPPLMAKK